MKCYPNEVLAAKSKKKKRCFVQELKDTQDKRNTHKMPFLTQTKTAGLPGTYAAIPPRAPVEVFRGGGVHAGDVGGLSLGPGCASRKPKSHVSRIHIGGSDFHPSRVEEIEFIKSARQHRFGTAAQTMKPYRIPSEHYYF